MRTPFTPRRLRLAAIAALGLVAAGWALSGCVHVFRGAIVDMNFSTLDSNVPTEHYELFANVGDGAVSVGKFKVIDALDHTLTPPPDGVARQSCLGDPLVTHDVQLVQTYAEDYDADRQCGKAERIGTIDKLVDGVSIILVGGVQLNTEVDLSDADSLFLSLEPDGETDPAPAHIVLHADLGEGTDPLTCQHPGETPKSRRGVLLGSFVPAGSTAPCPVPTGRVAIVPAEDDTTL